MCGILCFLNGVAFDTTALIGHGLINDGHEGDGSMPDALTVEDYREALSCRGPDLMECVDVMFEDSAVSLTLAGSLLQLRGEEKSHALFMDRHSNALILNGEIYDGLSISPKENDAAALSVALELAHETDIVRILSTLMGPWSLIYWKKEARELWFGRDALGRRSLLFYYHPVLRQCSIASTVPLSREVCHSRFAEICPALYRLKFEASNLANPAFEVMHRWITDPVGRSFFYPSLHDATCAFLDKLKHSVKVRYEHSSSAMLQASRAPVMILFSGGVDSALLAILLHEVMPINIPIDLCNISFDGENAPDRINSIEAIYELQQRAPERQFNLIRVDSSLDAVHDFKDRIMKLITPCRTIMDWNIGCAIWLAGRGQGRLHPSDLLCTSDARIVFVGHGADEQCAGYARHRTKFREGNWSAVEEELVLEMCRLWRRNLGRDDRLISDHGREVRFPFLDEDVVEFLKRLPLSFLFDPSQPRGVGEKIILRQALRILGLNALSTKAKRAIQFGTHIGKLTNRNTFGSNRSANRQHAGGLNLERE